jgi:hypothetical protein
MAKKQSDRYNSAGDLAADLRKAAYKWKTKTNSYRRMNLSHFWTNLRPLGSRVSNILSHPFWVGLIGGLIILGLGTIAARSLELGPFQGSPTPTLPVPTLTFTAVYVPTRTPTPIPTSTITPVIATEIPTINSTAEEMSTPEEQPTIRSTPTPFLTYTPES